MDAQVDWALGSDQIGEFVAHHYEHLAVPGLLLVLGDIPHIAEGSQDTCEVGQGVLLGLVVVTEPEVTTSHRELLHQVPLSLRLHANI